MLEAFSYYLAAVLKNGASRCYLAVLAVIRCYLANCARNIPYVISEGVTSPNRRPVICSIQPPICTSTGAVHGPTRCTASGRDDPANRFVPRVNGHTNLAPVECVVGCRRHQCPIMRDSCNGGAPCHVHLLATITKGPVASRT